MSQFWCSLFEVGQHYCWLSFVDWLVGRLILVGVGWCSLIWLALLGVGWRLLDLVGVVCVGWALEMDLLAEALHVHWARRTASTCCNTQTSNPKSTAPPKSCKTET